MAYVDGFVAAVPNANKQKFIEHAQVAAEVFMEYGALGVVDCWGDEVPQGEVTSFPLAVQCKDDETVCFSWIRWPSRDIRNQAMEKAMQDPRFDPEQNPMPFDGMRLIYGGFEVIAEI